MKLNLFKWMLLATIPLSIFSCTDDYFEFDEITTDEWRPELALPLINSKLTLEDIVVKNDTNELIQFNPDLGVMEIVYDGSVFSKQGVGLIDLPSQVFNESLSLPSNTLPSTGGTFNQNFDREISYNSPAEIDSIKLRNGKLVLSLRNTFSHNVTVVVSLNGFRNNLGNPLILNYNLTPNQTQSFEENLQGFTIDMTDGTPAYNNLNLNFDVTFDLINGNSNNANDQIEISGGISNLVFQEFTGYAGNQVLDLDLDTIDINIFDNFITGEFFITNPLLRINVLNSYGLPVNMEFERLTASNPDKAPQDKLDIVLPNDTGSNNIIRLNSPQKFGLDTTNLTLDTNDSNIDDVISFLLSELIYDARAIINLTNDRTQRNFVTDTSRIGLDVSLRLPFDGRASDFILVDTIDFTFEEAEEIEKGTIRVIADNGFPVDVRLQVLFVDANYNRLDSLYQNGLQRIIPSSPIDNRGEAIGKSRQITDASIDRSRFQQLEQSSFAIIQAELNTADVQTGQNVRFLPGNTLEIAVGIKAGILID